ncbi:hypothetical protein [Streptomyces sp. NPDC020951]|uniref:hypothetical protein n=1 Tax=Streptomyces sp. NPDC020951 TaxID=3365104 RepID=UPI0037A37C09
MPFVTSRLEAVQYDGANGQFIANEFLSNTTIESDDGQLLRLVDGTNDPQVHLGWWVIRQAISVGLYQYLGTYVDADFQARYAVLP